MEWGWIAGAAGLVTAVGAAVIAFRKAGPESSQILVDAAADVVVIQRDWITKAEARAELAENRLDEAMRQIGELKTLEFEVATMRVKLQERDMRIAALEAENAQLRDRVSHLENGG